MHRINKKKDKKLNKDITIAVSSPLTLGIKYLTTDNIARAGPNETAVLLRAVKPVTATITMILKNEKLLDWDHPLLLAAIKAILDHQINTLLSRKKYKLANKLTEDKKSLLDLLIEDQLLLTPKTVHATFNALFTKDPHYTNILDLYKEQRTHILSEPQNRQKSLARITGFCIGYNFKSDCDNPSCAFTHHCLLHNEPQQHKTMNCADNPNRWNKRPSRNFDSSRNKRRNRGRGRGGFYRQQQFQQHHQPNIHGFYPQVPPWAQMQYVQYPQQYPQQNMDRGNKDRHQFFPPKQK